MLGERAVHCSFWGLLKTVLVCFLDREWSMFVVSKILLKMNGLNWVENELLMHIIKCVNMMLNYIKI